MPISYQAQSPVLGLVLPSNSPGVHTLWLPIIPMQIGLVLKPGPQEPWTPYRMAEAFFAAGIPREAISIYPGGADVGAAVLDSCARSLIFGGTPTVDRYRGNPRVQAHGPGFSKILLGDDEVDDWERYLDVMVESVFINSGRSCINCSGIWASRHTREIADAIAAAAGGHPAAAARASRGGARRLHGARRGRGDLAVDRRRSAGAGRHRRDREAPGRRRGSSSRAGRTTCCRPSCTASRRTRRSRRRSSCSRSSPSSSVRRRRCSRRSARRSSARRSRATRRSAAQLLDAVHIDRLNLGPVPTTQLNWLQPHEGNIVEFLFRARAFQSAADWVVDGP